MSLVTTHRGVESFCFDTKTQTLGLVTIEVNVPYEDTIVNFQEYQHNEPKEYDYQNVTGSVITETDDINYDNLTREQKNEIDQIIYDRTESI